jgi:hypothetical protein
MYKKGEPTNNWILSSGSRHPLIIYHNKLNYSYIFSYAGAADGTTVFWLVNTDIMSQKISLWAMKYSTVKEMGISWMVKYLRRSRQ